MSRILIGVFAFLGFGALLIAMLYRGSAPRWVAWGVGVGLIVVSLLLARTV